MFVVYQKIIRVKSTTRLERECYGSNFFYLLLLFLIFVSLIPVVSAPYVSTELANIVLIF